MRPLLPTALLCGICLHLSPASRLVAQVSVRWSSVSHVGEIDALGPVRELADGRVVVVDRRDKVLRVLAPGGTMA
ncbi:MAG: hypothetical protein MUF00_20250, partial [Gemmatimonadaceae bacterium]|nr:hypothetical protein [Gemmatimonadaceae bacterium]